MSGKTFAMFGDSAFPLGRHMQRILKGKHLTHDQHVFNAYMARLRICIENCFAEIHQAWPYTADCFNQKLGLQRVGMTYMVATFLHNCLGCFRGNQMSAQYGYDNAYRMDLHTYLSMRDADPYDVQDW